MSLQQQQCHYIKNFNQCNKRSTSDFCEQHEYDEHGQIRQIEIPPNQITGETQKQVQASINKVTTYTNISSCELYI
jgi:hypothetical protein